MQKQTPKLGDQVSYKNDRGIIRTGKVVRGLDVEEVAAGKIAVLHNAGYTVYVSLADICKMPERASFSIYAFENTKAKLCAGKAGAIDAAMKDLIVAEYERRGLVVDVECEE